MIIALVVMNLNFNWDFLLKVLYDYNFVLLLLSWVHFTSISYIICVSLPLFIVLWLQLTLLSQRSLEIHDTTIKDSILIQLCIRQSMERSFWPCVAIYWQNQELHESC